MSDDAPEQTTSEPNLASAPSPTQESKPSGALFGLVLVLIVVAAGAGVWWYIGQRSAAAESAALKAIGELDPGVFVREVDTGSQVNLSTLKSKEKLDQAAALLDDCYNITDLNANNNELFGDEHLKHLAHISAMRSLQLNYTGITDEGMPAIADLTDLKALYVHGTNITEKGIAAINGLKNLTNLNISGTKVSGDLSELIGLDALDWIVLNDLELEDSVVDTLVKLPKLSRVSVGTSNISAAAIQKLKDGKPGIHIDEPGSPVEGG